MSTQSATQDGKIGFDPVKEIRMAVVIYGGVSLAIYINGIVQEMLRFVRATAPSPPPDATETLLAGKELEGSERVYRKLGQILGNPDSEPAVEMDRLEKDPALPIRTRFVIDILSGTSAGGINAVFLAKALTNNQQLGALKELWKTEGDIEKLINDAKSATPPLSRQRPPQSLLNSNRMYLQLLKALDGMDSAAKKEPSVALVEELDLFSTTTDIRGLTLPITLADGVVEERRHKNFFHFQYPSGNSGSLNASSPVEKAGTQFDFGQDCNPFLAFAARATSAFPFAFEPMQLSDIFPTIQALKPHAGKEYTDPAKKYWCRFYDDYERQVGLAPGSQRFESRAFGDGGYLDNKPFKYAIDTTLIRHSDLPVERKLVYIEPNPDALTPQPGNAARPNALENSMAALLTLPRYETIREDLERIVSRNLEIERVKRVVDDLRWTRDAQGIATEQTQWPALAPTWRETPDSWLAGSAEIYGLGYAAYERLKLSSVTDQLADMLARAYKVDTRGAAGRAVRVLAGEWRKRAYDTPAKARMFLLQFDIEYRLRRVRYLRRRIQEEYIERSSQQQLQDAAFVEYRLLYREELRAIKAALHEPYVMLRGLLRLQPELLKLSTGQEIFSVADMQLVAEPPSNVAVAKALAADKYQHYKERTDRGARDRANFVLDHIDRESTVTALADALAERFRPVLEQARDAIGKCFVDDETLPTGKAEARRFAQREFSQFELYDSAAFPITFGTDVDDNGPISIHRISPEDATARELDILKGRMKLRGQLLGSFGGFLDLTWRRNDILWGQLDGAERLISMCLPGEDPATSELRSQLIDEAHREIVAADDDLRADTVCGCKKGKCDCEKDWQAPLRRFIASVPAQPEPRLVATSAARGTAVVGELLEGLSDTYASGAKPFFSRIAFFGRCAWALVEVSVPRTVGELFGSYWINLLGLFAAAFMVLAFVVARETLPLAATIMALYIGLSVGRWTLRRYLRGAEVVTPATAAGATALVAALLTVLVVYVLNGDWMSMWHQILCFCQKSPDAAASDSLAFFKPLVRAPAAHWTWAFLGASGALVISSGFWVSRTGKLCNALTGDRRTLRRIKSAGDWEELFAAMKPARRALVSEKAASMTSEERFEEKQAIKEARAAVIRGEAIRGAAIRAQRVDYVFAAAYGLLFIAAASCALLNLWPLQMLSLACWILAAVLGVIAAILNMLAGARVIRVLATQLPDEPALPALEWPRRYTFAKWVAVAAALLAAVAGAVPYIVEALR